MSNFKPKNTKPISDSKAILQLDGKHENYIKEFTQDESTILPKLIEKRKELYNKFTEKCSTISFDEKIELKEQINYIDNEIKSKKCKKKTIFFR